MDPVIAQVPGPITVWLGDAAGVGFGVAGAAGVGKIEACATVVGTAAGLRGFGSEPQAAVTSDIATATAANAVFGVVRDMGRSLRVE
jgi:hypothetical protein